MFVIALALVEPLPVEYNAQYFSSLNYIIPFQKNWKDRASKLTEGLIKIGVSRIDKYSEKKTFFFPEKKVAACDVMSIDPPKNWPIILCIFVPNRTENNVFSIASDNLFPTSFIAY